MFNFLPGVIHYIYIPTWKAFNLPIFLSEKLNQKDQKDQKDQATSSNYNGRPTMTRAAQSRPCQCCPMSGISASPQTMWLKNVLESTKAGVGGVPDFAALKARGDNGLLALELVKECVPNPGAKVPEIARGGRRTLPSPTPSPASPLPPAREKCFPRSQLFGFPPPNLLRAHWGDEIPMTGRVDGM